MHRLGMQTHKGHDRLDAPTMPGAYPEEAVRAELNCPAPEHASAGQRVEETRLHLINIGYKSNEAAVAARWLDQCDVTPPGAELDVSGRYYWYCQQRWRSSRQLSEIDRQETTTGQLPAVHQHSAQQLQRAIEESLASMVYNPLCNGLCESLLEHARQCGGAPPGECDAVGARGMTAR